MTSASSTPSRRNARRKILYCRPYSNRRGNFCVPNTNRDDWNHNKPYSWNIWSRRLSCRNLPRKPHRIRRTGKNSDTDRIHTSRRRMFPHQPADWSKSPNRNGRHICHNKNCCKDMSCSGFATKDKNLTGYIRFRGRPGHHRVHNGHICRHRTAQRRNKVWYRFRSYWRHIYILWHKSCPRGRDCRHATRPDRDVCHIRRQYTGLAENHNSACCCRLPAFRWD